VLFPASPALYSGANDECVEAESGCADSCTRVGAAFSSVVLVTTSEERFMKGTSAAVGEVVHRRLDRARSSSDVSRQRVLIQGWRSSGHAPGRCSYSVFFIPASVSGVSCGFFKPFRQWGSSSSGAAMGSSLVVAAGVGSKAAVDGVCWWLPGPSV
jgi:hypothetical protein